MTKPGCTRKVVGPLVWTSGTNSKSTTTGDQLGFTPTPNGKLILKFSAMVVGLEEPAAEVKVARGNCIPTCPLTSYPYCCALAKSCAPADLDRATFTTNKTTERVASLDRLAARCTERGMAIKTPPTQNAPRKSLHRRTLHASRYIKAPAETRPVPVSPAASAWCRRSG